MGPYLFIRPADGDALQRIRLDDVPSLFCVRDVEPLTPPTPLQVALARAAAMRVGVAMRLRAFAGRLLPRAAPAALATK